VQDEVNQEENEQNEVDGMKSGVEVIILSYHNGHW